MAAFLHRVHMGRSVVLCTRIIPMYYRNLSNVRSSTQKFGNTFWIISGGIATFIAAHLLKVNSVKADEFETVKMNIGDITEVTGKTKRRNLCHRISEIHLEKNVQLTGRERQFIKFASVEFNGQLYMTPKDFLDSLVEAVPRPRLKRHELNQHHIDKMKKATPMLRRGSSRLFRGIRDNGIISYTEYLFLLSILTETPAAFEIAFKMFDTDCNQKIDMKEFLIIHTILGGAFKEHEVDENTKLVLLRLVSTDDQARNLIVRSVDTNTWWERLFNQHHYRVKIKMKAPKDESNEMMQHNKKETTDQEIEEETPMVMTTLLTHLFGGNGDNVVHYGGLSKFTDDLQREVLEVEFNEYAKGHKTISDIDFTRILLRYTYMDVNKYDVYLERLLSRMDDDEQGIEFEEFFLFCRFLNHLEDFIVAIRMYQIAMSAISHENFMRAVSICTGYRISHHLVDVLFALFDEDGDGLISYDEFITVMKDRLFRGFKSTEHNVGMKAFKLCVNNELKYT